MLAGTLVWELGRDTMSLSPELVERLGLTASHPDAVHVSAYRDRIVAPDVDGIYERLARSFLHSEPLTNFYALRLVDGTTIKVRSSSRWELVGSDKPTRLISVISEVDGAIHSEIEDEFIERLIELRFLAEKLPDKSYRALIDELLEEVWKRRRPA